MNDSDWRSIASLVSSRKPETRTAPALHAWRVSSNEHYIEETKHVGKSIQSCVSCEKKCQNRRTETEMKVILDGRKHFPHECKKVVGVQRHHPALQARFDKMLRQLFGCTVRRRMTQVHPGRPKYTQDDPSTPRMTQVHPGRPKYTQDDPSTRRMTQVHPG
jgi:hypothetical protein